MGIECRIGSSPTRWFVYANKNAGAERLFEYTNKEAKGKITSAYTLRTYCIYNNGRYDIDVMREEYVRLWPDYETVTTILGMDGSVHGHGNFNLEMTYSDFLKGVSEIWEYREKLSSFPFKVEKIKHFMVMQHFIEPISDTK